MRLPIPDARGEHGAYNRVFTNTGAEASHQPLDLDDFCTAFHRRYYVEFGIFAY